MRMLTPLLVSLLLALTCAAAQARINVTYSSQGKQYFSIDIPDAWQLNVGFEVDPAQMPEGEKPMSRVVTAIPDDGTDMWFGMWVPSGVANFAQAHEYMKTLDTDLLTDVVPGKKRQDTLNGMQVYYLQGIGKKADEVMEYYGMYLQLAQDAVAIAIYIGNPETTALYDDELKEMINTLRPIVQ